MKYFLLLTSLLWLSLLAGAQSQKDTAAAKIKDTPALGINLAKLPKSDIRLIPRYNKEQDRTIYTIDMDTGAAY